MRTLLILLLAVSTTQAGKIYSGDSLTYIMEPQELAPTEPYTVSHSNITFTEDRLTPTTVGHAEAVFRFPFDFPVHTGGVHLTMYSQIELDQLAYVAIDVSPDGLDWQQVKRFDRFNPSVTIFQGTAFGGYHFQDVNDVWVRLRAHTETNPTAAWFLNSDYPWPIGTLRVSGSPEFVPEPLTIHLLIAGLIMAGILYQVWKL